MILDDLSGFYKSPDLRKYMETWVLETTSPQRAYLTEPGSFRVGRTYTLGSHPGSVFVCTRVGQASVNFADRDSSYQPLEILFESADPVISTAKSYSARWRSGLVDGTPFSALAQQAQESFFAGMKRYDHQFTRSQICKLFSALVKTPADIIACHSI